MNGWQRLWAVASVIVGLGLVGIGWQNIPTEESEAEERFQASLLLPELRLPSKYTAEADKRAEAAYDEFKENLIDRQLGYVAKLLAAWAGVCAGLYVLGYSFGWVYRGFRPKQM
ncbi:hypothetical protein H097_12983 [Pseudomonas sp. FH4]|uniref:hypothetical protein n=1 Tax=Pseudomonas fluorescens group TaxID=136843 RepID=UPI0003DC2DD7|nr:MULTISPECIES: hypothetical protein [Pseudomonas fluorescens group]ETK18220.1 hypothetical protein H097_12983 [Pseudomonas sp. FH4]MBF8007144.1 hypothetical protein [Pseudomonas brenneri]